MTITAWAKDVVLRLARVPAEPFSWAPEMLLAAIAAALVATARWRYLERDIG